MRRNSVTFIKFILISFLLTMLIITSITLFSAPNVVETDKPGAMHARDVENYDPLALIDWHNYTQIALESKRTGPGEQGGAVNVDPSEKKELDKLFSVNGFNALASDKISMQRSIPDIRHRDCKKQRYQRSLPTVSIIIPFHEEHFTTLLRTVHTSLDRAPPYLIKEVILVDDGSSKPFLKEPLEAYVREHFTNVRVLRQAKREGLIRTRLLGAKNATGQVLLFLDSHCEANVNYLPPLLQPIAEDYRTVVCPFIDVIDHDTFHYRAQDEGARGAWDWELYYKRLPLLPDDLAHPARPFKSPVMAGGLFAISTKWFWELGGYDPQLEIWGGEQYELSFKLWQCGGTMVDAPCSRIGHIYRKYSPFPNSVKGDFLGRNYKRVAEVWMDEYKEYLYVRRPQYRTLDPGDLTEQKALRDRLQCKPFKWFMENIAFDQPLRYPPVEPPLLAEGDIRSAADPTLCIDTRFVGSMKRFPLSQCIRDHPHANGGEQKFDFTFRRDIRPHGRGLCFDVSVTKDHAPLLLFDCHNMKGNQHWRYHPNTRAIFHVMTSQCLDCDIERKELFMNPCAPQKATQQWIWQEMKKDMLLKDW